MNEISDSEKHWRFFELSQCRCVCCWDPGPSIIHHEPAGNGFRNHRRAVPLCPRCHETRHRPSPSQTHLALMIRRTCEERAIENDAVFALWKLIEAI